MSLDVIKLAAQLLEATSTVRAQDTTVETKLANALSQFESANAASLETKRRASARTLI